MNVGSVFSGIGLFDLGLHLAGIRHLWGCEADPWRRELWERRFGAPCHADIRELRGDAVQRVDVLAGGFPCKGASTAGRREGFGHPETVLWREMRRVIGELRPRYVVVENVGNLLAIHDGAVWGEVLGDLASFGFDAEWDCFPAAAFGAPHLRDRVFLVAAHSSGCGWGAPERDLRAGELDTARGAASDPEGGGGQGARPGRSALGGASGNGHPASPDPGCERRQQVTRGAHGDEADEGRPAERDHELAGAFEEVGRRVDWGEYEPAIRRWEAVHGTAPQPLIRGVDDRSAARVVRSRLSALGDGVQVQAGWFVGRRLMELDAHLANGARPTAAGAPTTNPGEAA